MRLLLDNNLSYRLIARLADRYPGSQHVVDVGLARATDEEIWEFCRINGLIVVSKDTDFYYRSLLFGPPPKTIWLRLGNCRSSQIADLLLERLSDVTAFMDDPDAALLILP